MLAEIDDRCAWAACARARDRLGRDQRQDASVDAALTRVGDDLAAEAPGPGRRCRPAHGSRVVRRPGPQRGPGRRGPRLRAEPARRARRRRRCRRGLPQAAARWCRARCGRRHHDGLRRHVPRPAGQTVRGLGRRDVRPRRARCQRFAGRAQMWTWRGRGAASWAASGRGR